MKNLPSKCDICGKTVYFEHHPEYDVCVRCDAHICSDCGISDPINGDIMCKTHRNENH